MGKGAGGCDDRAPMDAGMLAGIEQRHDVKTTLQLIIEEYIGDQNKPADLASLITQLQNCKPPLSKRAGEPIIVEHLSSGDNTHYKLQLHFVGQQSNDNYAHITTKWHAKSGEFLDIANLRLLPAYVSMAVNSPEDLPWDVGETLHQAGRDVIICDHCGESFSQYRQALEHERAEHQ